MSDTENDTGHDPKRRRLGDSQATHSQRYEPGVAGPSTAMSLSRLLSPAPETAPFPRESLTQSPQRNEGSYVPDSMDDWLKREEEEMQAESQLNTAGVASSPPQANAASTSVPVREPRPDDFDHPHGDDWDNPFARPEPRSLEPRPDDFDNPHAREPNPDDFDHPHGDDWDNPFARPEPRSLESWLAEEAEAASGKGKGKAKAIPNEELFKPEKLAPTESLPHLSQLAMASQAADPPPPPAEPARPRSPTPPPAAEYNCPICFCPPTSAVLTPCGHIMCGSCLFSAIETALQRARMNGYGGEALEARCPVCRAKLEQWDGKGGGVIGLALKVSLDVP